MPFTVNLRDIVKTAVTRQQQSGQQSGSATTTRQVSDITTVDLQDPPRQIPKLEEFAAEKRVASTNLKIEARELAVDRVLQKETLPDEEHKKEEKEKEEITSILTAGRFLKVIPQQNFSQEYQQFLNSMPENNKGYIPDSLRGKLGSFWTKDTKDNAMFARSQKNSKSAQMFDISFGTTHNKKVKSDFGVTEEWVDIKAKRKKFSTAKDQYSKDFWSAFVRGVQYDGSTKNSDKIRVNFDPTVKTSSVEYFYDYVHEMPIPLSAREVELNNISLNSLVANINPEYNFYIKSYEEKINNDNAVLENTLPNMYVFQSELSSDNPSPEFKKFITLGNNLETEQEVFAEGSSRKKFDIKEHPIGQYYDIYARQYDKAKQDRTIAQLNTKFSNLLVADTDLSLIKEFNEKKEMFPMVVDISFSTDKTTTFAQILKDSGLSNSFMVKVANKVFSEDFQTFSAQETRETIFQDTPGSSPTIQSKINSTQKKYWDLLDISKELLELDEELNNDSVFLGEYENSIKKLQGKEYQFYKTILFTIFFGKLQDLIKNKFRTYKDLVNGKTAYNETVMYRVAKYEGGKDGLLLQNYYFPNSNELDVLNFIDTQVKYNKKYTYVVYAYQMVIGNKYKYQDLEVESYDHHASFRVEQEPSVILVENEFYSFTGKVLDDPPIFPEVDVIPYKGIDDQVLLTFNGSVGNYVAQPILINPEDEIAIDELRKERGLKESEPIRFKSDDHVSRFEIYRIEQHPKEYTDFEGNLLTVVETDIDLKTLQSATSAAFVDRIEPNKKYYYLFRAIDVHDHFSNPTQIYRVEMINDQGTIFLLKDVVELQKEKKFPSKKARRYIQIVPSLLQSFINEKKSGFENAQSAEDLRNKIHLGVTDETLWGKTFVIRLNSRSTGKKIDLRVVFEHKHKEKQIKEE